MLEGVDQGLRVNCGLSAQRGFDLRRRGTPNSPLRGSDSGAPPQTPQIKPLSELSFPSAKS